MFGTAKVDLHIAINELTLRINDVDIEVDVHDPQGFPEASNLNTAVLEDN